MKYFSSAHGKVLGFTQEQSGLAFFFISFTSSIFSGSEDPRVSGRQKAKRPPRMEEIPIISIGSFLANVQSIVGR